MPGKDYFLQQPFLCKRGGYCTFIGNIIIKKMIIKIAISNFFAIRTMLTFHKHNPLSQTQHMCLYVKVGITAGEYTVKKSCLAGLLQRMLLYTIIRYFSRDFIYILKNPVYC